MKISESKTEEIISVLWVIAALSALNAGFPIWVFVLMICKALFDVICSIAAAIHKPKKEKLTK